MTSSEEQYRAATEGIGLYDASQRGRIRLSGSDHLEFMQRLSTNDVLNCAEGAGLQTVFCDPRGRIMQVTDICRIGADVSYAFVGPDKAPALIEWLDRFHFSERIEWEDESDTTEQIEIIGPLAASVAADVLGLDAASEPALGLLRHTALEAIRVNVGPHTGIRIWGTDLADICDKLKTAGAVSLSQDTREVLRVQWGVPGEAELTPEHNPWEAGLDDAIHMNKGCYIGQEVVARLDTYNKVKQHLVGLHLQAPVPSGALLESNGKAVGVVTSTAQPPGSGPLALAYARTAYCAPDSVLDVIVESAAPVSSRVSALPFKPSAKFP